MALSELEAGNDDAAMKLLSENIHPQVCRRPLLSSVTDAIALLWRMELSGRPRNTDLWRSVAEEARKSFPHGGVAFADAHIALADAVTGDAEALRTRLDELAELERRGRLPSGPLVPALARGFTAFTTGDWEGVIAALLPVMGEHERIGGSRAQRDLVEFTLLKAYINADRMDDVRRYLSSRRSGSVTPHVAGLPE